MFVLIAFRTVYLGDNLKPRKEYYTSKHAPKDRECAMREFNITCEAWDHVILRQNGEEIREHDYREHDYR